MISSLLPLVLSGLLTVSNSEIDLAEGCVYGAKDVSSYRVIDTGYGAKIYFSGYTDFIVELDDAIYSSTFDEIYFIKDDFCSWESDVLVIDGEVYGVQKVTKLD